jgi:hypothetical protein
MWSGFMWSGFMWERLQPRAFARPLLEKTRG